MHSPGVVCRFVDLEILTFDLPTILALPHFYQRKLLARQ